MYIGEIYRLTRRKSLSQPINHPVHSLASPGVKFKVNRDPIANRCKLAARDEIIERRQASA
jgi:hypothetical protein